MAQVIHDKESVSTDNLHAGERDIDFVIGIVRDALKKSFSLGQGKRLPIVEVRLRIQAKHVRKVSLGCLTTKNCSGPVRHSLCPTRDYVVSAYAR